jgi:hypothetical protein
MPKIQWNDQQYKKLMVLTNIHLSKYCTPDQQCFDCKGEKKCKEYAELI